MKKFYLILWLSAIFLPATTQARNRICERLGYGCDDSSNSPSGASYPGRSESSSSNPSSIPTRPAPLGLELLYGDKELLYGLFKGYGGFGLAGGDLTKENFFFSNSSNISAAGIDLGRDVGGDINKRNIFLGTAIPLFRKKFRKWMVPTIGVGVRYYQSSKNFRESYGFGLEGRTLALGVGFAKNDENIGVLNYRIGLNLEFFNIEYTYIRNLEGIKNRTNIYSLAFALGKRWTFFLAYRDQDVYLTPNEVLALKSEQKTVHSKHTFGGIQVNLTRSISIAAYHNYVIEGSPHFGMRIVFGKL